jgi:hypothetical protein
LTVLVTPDVRRPDDKADRAPWHRRPEPGDRELALASLYVADLGEAVPRRWS